MKSVPVLPIVGAVAVGTAFVAVPPIVLPMLGFGAGGVTGGSIAAMVQAKIGNVAAGSLFAYLQSAGATGVGLGATRAAAGAAAGAAGGEAVRRYAASKD